MSGSKKKLERREAMAAAGLTEKEKQEMKKAAEVKRNKLLFTVVGIVAAVAVIALLVWHSGIIARSTTALTVKDTKFTVADMDYYYYQALNSAYSQDQVMASYYEQMGLEYTSAFDPNADLRTQYVDADQTQSYHDYFLESAKTSVVQLTALYDDAKANGYTLSEDAQADLDEALASLDSQVSTYNFGSREAYLKAVYGRNMTEKVYMKNLEFNILASDYYTATTNAMSDYSDEELAAYYEENPGRLDSYTYNYAYFSGSVASTEDEDGNTVEPTDEEKAAALTEAKENAEALISAVKTEGKDFATAADSTSTLREDVLGVNFASAAYAEWLMDSSRKDNDIELFELEGQGYYVIQFHSRERNDDPTVDVRHILLSTSMEDDPETSDVDESKDPTDAYVEEIRQKASDILKEFTLGDQTADAFGELAEEYSEDGRDSDNNLYATGGLYEGVAPGDMVESFNDWIFDSDRVAGDTGLVQSPYGWHVMYFQAYHEPSWKTQAQSDKSTAEQNEWLDSVEEGYEAVEGSGFKSVGI